MTNDRAKQRAERQREVQAFLKAQAQLRREQTAQLHDKLKDEAHARTIEINEKLNQFARQRTENANSLRKELEQNRANLADQIADNLLKMKENREAMAQQLREDLMADKVDRAADVSAILDDFISGRQSLHSNLKDQLKVDYASRSQAVQDMLGSFAQERPRYQPKTKANQPEPTPKKAKPTSNMAKTATIETKVQISSSITANELVSYLMEFTGKPNMEQLENFFGAERLNHNWEDFLNLLEELRPGGKSDLEAAKQQKAGKVEKDINPAELFSYLALHPDGLSVEELSQHFGVSHIQMTRQLKKLIESGKATKKDKLYTAS